MKLSRRQVAEYIADGRPKQRHEAIREAAAWLIDSGRSRQAKYLAADVAQILETRGYLLVRLVTARPLTDHAHKHITAYLKQTTGATELEVEVSVEPALIGGVRVETPSAQLDDTVKGRLDRLVRGVS